MTKLITRGQLLFGIAIAAFGVENLICAHLRQDGSLPLRSFVGSFWHYPFSCSRLYRQPRAGLASRALVLGVSHRYGFHCRRDQHRDQMDGPMVRLSAGNHVCPPIPDSPLAEIRECESLS
jgi:hypothetical protein